VPRNTVAARVVAGFLQAVGDGAVLELHLRMKALRRPAISSPASIGQQAAEQRREQFIAVQAICRFVWLVTSLRGPPPLPSNRAQLVTCLPVFGPIIAGKFQFGGVCDSSRWTRKDHEDTEVLGGAEHSSCARAMKVRPSARSVARRRSARRLTTIGARSIAD
jgi:hypothetical protein